MAVSQWGFSKGYDNSTPLGPVLVAASSETAAPGVVALHGKRERPHPLDQPRLPASSELTVLQKSPKI